MNRAEKEEYVIRLYKENKSTREIANLTHMSFRDIGAITRDWFRRTNPEGGCGLPVVGFTSISLPKEKAWWVTTNELDANSIIAVPIIVKAIILCLVVRNHMWDIVAYSSTSVFSNTYCL